MKKLLILINFTILLTSCKEPKNIYLGSSVIKGKISHIEPTDRNRIMSTRHIFVQTPTLTKKIPIYSNDEIESLHVGNEVILIVEKYRENCNK